MNNNFEKLNNKNEKEMKIELAIEKDLESITNIWFKEIAQDDRLLKEDAKELRLKEYQDKFKDPDNCFFVVRDLDDHVAGFIHCFIERNKYETKQQEDIIGWIKTIGVKNSFRNTGVAEKLIDNAIKSFFKEKKVHFVYIKIPHQKAPHFSFYKSKGFEDFVTIFRKKISV